MLRVLRQLPGRAVYLPQVLVRMRLGGGEQPLPAHARAQVVGGLSGTAPQWPGRPDGPGGAGSTGVEESVQGAAVCGAGDAADLKARAIAGVDQSVASGRNVEMIMR